MTSVSIENLCSKLERNKSRVCETFGNISESGWGKNIYTEPYEWNYHDLLAHFVSTEMSLLSLLKNIELGGDGANEDFNYNEFNKKENIKYKQYLPNELLELFIKNREATIEWTRNIDEKKLLLKGMHPSLGKITIREIIMSIYGHVLMHLRDL